MYSVRFLIARRLACQCALLSLPLAAALAPSALATTFTCTTAAQFTSALTSVNPGDTIVLSGTITSTSTFITSRAGTAAAPITIQGDGTAVLTGSSSYGLEIVNDYYRLNNFKIQNASKGLVIDNANHGAVDHVHVMDIQQEGFKVRNQSQYWVFTYCSVRRTGKSGDFGEGFYVGQASSNWIGGVPDRCGFVTFFNCYATDTVNDGWDCKEGSHHVKIVNCSADYSGATEPAAGAAHGSAGFYIRCDNVQLIKCNVINLNNGTWGYRLANDTVGGVDYGSTGNEIKQSAITSGNVPLIYSEAGVNGKVYTDCTTGPGGFYASGSATVTQPAPAGFVEYTWSGEGGGSYATLDPTVGADGDPMSLPPPSQVAAPSFSPGGGTYASAQSVTITTATSGATIRYTTDGSTPSQTVGTVYAAPVSISVTTTLKAIAYKSGMTDSTITSATYTISAPQAAAPTFSPGGGSYVNTQSVTISTATTGASIRYTTDGSTPTSTTGTLYSAPVTIAKTATLKAIAYKSGMTDSTVTSATYTIGVTINVATGFYNRAMGSSQTGTFTATVDAIPSISPSNTTIALCKGAQSAYTGLAAIVRFNNTGHIDARNGGAYAAASSIAFSAGVSYHFRLVVNVATHTYSAYVTPAGGSEITIGTNYAFRTEQNAVTSLDTWNVDVNSAPGGSVTVSNFAP